MTFPSLCSAFQTKGFVSKVQIEMYIRYRIYGSVTYMFDEIWNTSSWFDWNNNFAMTKVNRYLNRGVKCLVFIWLFLNLSDPFINHFKPRILSLLILKSRLGSLFPFYSKTDIKRFYPTQFYSPESTTIFIFKTR